MREPKLNNLKVDIAETTKLRRALKKQKLVKITINLDADSLEALKREASASGIPYQRLQKVADFRLDWNKSGFIPLE